jgi:hypothetical protein
MLLAHLWASGRSAETNILLISLKPILSNDLQVTGMMQTKFEIAEECGSFGHQIFGGLANLAPNSGYALHG